MKNTSFKVDVSPEMQLYKILQRQSYGIDTALSEFVDNSIQSFIDKRNVIEVIEKEKTKLNIKIIVDTLKKQIIIEDNAGGINKENFQRAIKMGYGDEHNRESLSVYGIGMKSAAVWFSNTWKIETSALGSTERLIASFDLDELLSNNEKEILVNIESEVATKHYTRIIINNSLRDLNEDFFEDSVLAYLKETFFKFKDFVNIELEFDNLMLDTRSAFLDTPQVLIYPPVDKNGEPLPGKIAKIWRKKIDLDYAGRKVKGFIMIRHTGSYKSNPGIRLLRNRRVILGTIGGSHPNKPDILVKTSNKYSAQRIYGEITLNDFPVNFTKTGFDENLDSLYELLRNVLTGHPSNTEDNYIHQSEYYRTKKSKKALVNIILPPPKKSLITIHPPKKPSNTIEFSNLMHDKLEELKEKRHSRLYKSLCKLSLIDHPILAYVGTWVLLESLATRLGKESNIAFDAFYNGKIILFTKDRNKKAEYKISISDIHSKGNLNKHSSKYETIDAKQLINDFHCIEDFLIFCIDEVLNSESEI